MIMGDADILDVFGLSLQLGEQFDDTLLRRRGSRTLPEAGIPHHVVVTVLDQIAAENKLNFEAVVGVGVAEAQADVRWGSAGAAVEARERHFGRRLRQR